jgi:hypothetical protein
MANHSSPPINRIHLAVRTVEAVRMWEAFFALHICTASTTNPISHRAHQQVHATSRRRCFASLSAPLQRLDDAEPASTAPGGQQGARSREQQCHAVLFLPGFGQNDVPVGSDQMKASPAPSLVKQPIDQFLKIGFSAFFPKLTALLLESENPDHWRCPQAVHSTKA